MKPLFGGVEDCGSGAAYIKNLIFKIIILLVLGFYSSVVMPSLPYCNCSLAVKDL